MHYRPRLFFLPELLRAHSDAVECVPVSGPLVTGREGTAWPPDTGHLTRRLVGPRHSTFPDPVAKGADRWRLRSLRDSFAAWSPGSAQCQALAQAARQERSDRAARFSPGQSPVPPRRFSCCGRSSHPRNAAAGAGSRPVDSPRLSRRATARSTFCRVLTAGCGVRGTPARRIARAAAPSRRPAGFIWSVWSIRVAKIGSQTAAKYSSSVRR